MTRQGLIGVAVIFMFAGAVVTQARLGHVDVAAMASTGLVSGAGLSAIDNAASVIGEIAREPEDFQAELADRYPTVRRFLPRLLSIITFGTGSKNGHDVLAALGFLQKIEKRRGRIAPGQVPANFLTAAWLRRAFPTEGDQAGEFDKRAYTVSVAERLRECLRRHEVFVPGLNPEPGVDLDRWAASLDGRQRRAGRPQRVHRHRLGSVDAAWTP